MAKNFKDFIQNEKQELIKAGVDLTSKIKKNKKFNYPKQPDKPKNLYDDFDKASTAIDETMMALGNQIIAGKIINTTLFKTTPGIGKTEAALHMSCHLATNNKVVFFSSATRNMAWQISDRIKKGIYGQGLKPIVVDGRHNGYKREWINDYGEKVEIDVKPNCKYYNRVKLAHKYGYPVYKYVCAKCSFCPHYKAKDGTKTGYKFACQYYRRLWEAAGWAPVVGNNGSTPIFLMTHHMMANFHTDSETMKDRMDLAIYDEDPTVALRRTHTWTEEDIKKKILHNNMKPFRGFLDVVLYIADFYRISSMYMDGEKYYKTDWKDDAVRDAVKQSKYMDSVIISGKSLAILLKHVAKNNKVDLIELLEMTSNMDTGLEDGEFFDFNVSYAHMLPHYKEPELANELKNIVEAAENGEELAYKVSLRWDPPVKILNKETNQEEIVGGWSIVWDEVGQVNYGKSLIYLDAYGEKIIADRIMGRPVDVKDIYCKVRENVNVKVFPSVNTSKSSMDKNKDEIFYTYVDPELRLLKGGKILFYTQKCYVSWLWKKIQDSNYGFKDVVIKYYWQDRGDDNYGDFDHVCLIGTSISNIVGERNFCNALFHGEEAIDWSVGAGYVPNDPRVKAHMAARQEKEMLQALFRIRPSKPREEPQNVLIFSNMKIPLEFEMPGATMTKQTEPSYDNQGIIKTIKEVAKKFGCWTDFLMSFYGKEEEIFQWFDNGDTEEFPVAYEELGQTFKRMANNKAYEKSKNTIVSVAMGWSLKEIEYHGKKISCFGNEEKLRALLDTLRLTTRVSGIDDEESGKPSEAPETYPAPEDFESALAATGAKISQTATKIANGDVEFKQETDSEPDEIVDSEILFAAYEEPKHLPKPKKKYDDENGLDPPPDEE